jgi:ATP-dependent helicase/nuclease subunit A
VTHLSSPGVRARAAAEQLRASDPAVSSFVSASAGSGKTKLLTDRLLRLMLSGADPARIQCLTFTKAAAAEMAVRLQSTLGAWVTLSDEALDAKLADLRITPTPEARAAARALFARVLDLPGGMRIGTIHAFCQSLLRRFPLEAQLSPHFRLVDEIDADIALREAREDMLAGAHTPQRRQALETLAGLASAEKFGELVAQLQLDRERLRHVLDLGPEVLEAALRRVLQAEDDEQTLLVRAATGHDADALRSAARRCAQRGAPGVRNCADKLLAWLSLGEEERTACWESWCDLFLKKSDGEPCALNGLVNVALARAEPWIEDVFFAEQQRILLIQSGRRAARCAAISAALVALAGPVAAAYANGKEAAGLVDYDDLIARTSTLLVDPGAAWVLYKLDGGLDHLLLDEVQDTAPAQWRIAGAITAEFFAGTGAQDRPRTVFAVGDRKQSIYSFQGADPDEFERWRAILRDRVEASGLAWRDVELDVSFRSTAPVLDLVDAVFLDTEAARGVVTIPGALRHIPDRALHAGSVELWPLAPLPEVEPPEAWSVPERNLSQVGAPQRLAEALADWIAAQTSGSVLLESQGRPLAPGDVLVLVRRRNAFASALVRALKTRAVPVAGLDRMVLTEQPAVADLLSLCDVLLLPEDDLALACVLKSPVGDQDDDDLIALAPTRTGSLWDELQRRSGERESWRRVHAMLTTLRARVDYASPHALLAEVLGPLGGRARLFARLGPEAAEPVDELLSAALAYAAAHPPSLQGFVHWLRQSGAEVKREAEGAGGAVRIMTVHGAKGLQAPLVILPDTTSLPPDEGGLTWAADPASNGGLRVPIWTPRKELRCEAGDALRDEAAARRAEEHNRLLYVALTRAEDRLVVCGWNTRLGPPETCWYRLVQRGFARLAATASAFDAGPNTWPGEILRHASPQRIPPDPPRQRAVTEADEPLPAWAGAAPLWIPRDPPPEPALPAPLAPSRPEGAEHGPVPQAESPLAARAGGSAALRRGVLVHALLQHLPGLAPQTREAAAQSFLARPGHGLEPAEAKALVAEVLAVLDDPALAPLFGPAGRAEVPLTGLVAGSVIGGMVDRLAVLPDRVLVADYKTNRVPPARPEDVPPLYLRQMAAYRDVLRGVFAGRRVACALVWTVGAQVMELPDSLLDGHAPRARPDA